MSERNAARLRIDDILQREDQLTASVIEFVEDLKYLRNLCAHGPNNQTTIATHPELNALLHRLLFTADGPPSPRPPGLLTMAWQLLANTIVMNTEAQRAFWTQHGEAMLAQCFAAPIDVATNVKLMILYNLLHGDTGVLDELQVLRIILQIWRTVINEASGMDLHYMHFFFERFLVDGARNTVRCYAHLEATERIEFLDYVVNYLQQNSPNGAVHKFLLNYLAKEFKIKSDCVMRHSTDMVDQVHPREAYSLLRVIATVSGIERYAAIYAEDHALFLNVSSLLRCLVAASKDPGTIYTPMTKLEQVAPASNVSPDYQQEVSYELKTLLVRCIANLLYQNARNQEYSIETELLPALLECTNMDARNPLMKEWSILAIRNACIGCPQIQEIIEGLTKTGEAPNDLITELNLQMGSLRIKPDKD